jgi:signal transduction histidine kinase
MKPKRTKEGNGLWILGAGFGLTILLLLGSAYLAIVAMSQGETRMVALVQQQQAIDRLIDDIQEQEAGLSSLFYSLALPTTAQQREAMLAQISTAEGKIEQTFAVARKGPDAEQWQASSAAVREFTRELRKAIVEANSVRQPSSGLLRAHGALVRELTSLVSANYQAAVEATAREDRLHSQRLWYALLLMGLGVVLSVVCAVKSIRDTTEIISHARWQTRELSRLSGHVLETQDNVVRRLSRELHDEFGQVLSAIEANLAAIPTTTPDQHARIEDCVLLVKDAMSNVRELSQLLRPSILDDFGLKASLLWLADSVRQRSGIEVEARIDYEGRLPEETETHLFRIAQEALTNALRHSGAKRVEIRLKQNQERLTLSISDDGHGLKPREGRKGFGMMGMRERMRAAAGELHVRSTPHGLTIAAEISLAQIREQQQKDPSPVS